MILVLDTENTTWNTGNPFDQRNFNVCTAYADRTGSGCLYSGDGDYLETIRRRLGEASKLVGFNLKYDLHWLRKLGIDFSGIRLYCCQVAEFILNRQSNPYPSLDESVGKYNLGSKLKVVESYWDRGINTHEIPREVLTPYATQDAELTYKLYEKQQSLIQPHQRALITLAMEDLRVLQEMEWNGLHFDKEESLRKSREVEASILHTQSSLGLYHNVPCFNWASNDHLSALLYGGTIVEERRIPVGFYKTGEKTGQPRFKIEEVVHHLPRMYNPIKGSELKKEGKWSVEEDYLLKLKGKNKTLIEGILHIKENQKLNNTYFAGLPKLHEEMHFEDGIIHGQFNQCVARTGRLSSSKPNLQNLSEAAQKIFTSRYAD